MRNEMEAIRPFSFLLLLLGLSTSFPLSAGADSYAASVLADNPTSYYRFDEEPLISNSVRS